MAKKATRVFPCVKCSQEVESDKKHVTGRMEFKCAECGTEFLAFSKTSPGTKMPVVIEDSATEPPVEDDKQ